MDSMSESRYSQCWLRAELNAQAKKLKPLRVPGMTKGGIKRTGKRVKAFTRARYAREGETPKGGINA